MNTASRLLFGTLLALAAHATCNAAASTGACHLLSNAEVAAAFPGAKAGVPETAREKYGFLGCEWATPRGRVAAQFSKSESPTTARAEAEGMMLGVLDPLKRSGAKAVRYESLPGVGESAVVAIARADANAGVLQDLAVATVVAGGRTITIFAPQLASEEPAKAIATLAALARNAAKR